MFKIFIGQELPHKKSREEQFEFVKKLHEKIDKPEEVEMFDRAIVSIIICLPYGCPKNKVWDVDNRAINLILNNLKGIFFEDDDYFHLSLFVCGKKSLKADTVILIDSLSNYAEVMKETMSLLDYWNPPYGFFGTFGNEGANPEPIS